MTIIKWFTNSIKSPVVRSCTRRYYEYLWTPSGLLLLVAMVTRTRSVVIAAGSVSQLVHTWDLSSFFFFFTRRRLYLWIMGVRVMYRSLCERSLWRSPHWRDFTSWLMIEPTSLTKLNKSILTSEISIKESKCNTFVPLESLLYYLCEVYNAYNYLLY